MKKQYMVEVEDATVKKSAKAQAKAKGMTLKGYISSLIRKDK